MRRRMTAALPVVLLAMLIVPPSHAAAPPTIDGPPMGWNSRALGCTVNDAAIRKAADDLTTLKDTGYRYVIIDGCWTAARRDASGRLTADPARFPDGIKALADTLHGKGLKLGLSLSAGTAACTGGGTGSYGHEADDGALVRDWGVDYVKYDHCSIPTADFPGQNSQTIAQTLATRMRQAIGDGIVFALNNEDGNSVPWLWAGQLATTWRTNLVTRPIPDTYAGMLGIWETAMLRLQYAGPRSHADPDLLQAGLGGMTETEYRTQVGLWAMAAAPLILQAAPTKAPTEIVANPRVIAVDQDPLGKPAAFVRTDGWHHVLSRPLAGGDVAVALYNESDRDKTISTTTTALKLGSASRYRVEDLWTGAVWSTTGAISAAVPAHGTVMYRVAARNEPSAAPMPTFEIDPATDPGDNRPSTVEPGKDNELLTRVTNTGGTATAQNITASLTVPDGWTAKPLTPATTRRLAPSATLTTRWSITPPAGTPQKTYPLNGKVVSDRWKAGFGGTAVVRVATAPDSGTTFLSDLPWTSAVNHLGPVEKDTSNGDGGAGDGRPLTIGGTRYAKGLGAHAVAEITYYTAGRCTTVEFHAGIDDEVDAPGAVRGSADFQVWADGELAARTGILTGDRPPAKVTASVKGAEYVRLVATNGGDNAYHDHTDFADAKITCD
ncbi:NPCBM/NEW2 domain-containing protein [Actinomadura hibisca]|uniref:NPCBM/NEW2 domain-containing protein n=1 Tax=Actinomadura hibisca TaxID=68565 RepID=UPI00083021D0|nr:NPCBM/NEW2 domain-containing protein [Actinomadura hibisca]